MPRVKDIAWKFVTRLEGEKWCCPYCETEYSGKVTRVKSHLLKHPNKGISPCKKVPEHISMLMDWLHNQDRNKEDIAWKFVDRLEDNKWRCHYCSEEFFGGLTGVKGHLLKALVEGTSVCTEVPGHVRTLMRSLLVEAAEEESRGANSQSSTEPQSRDIPAQVEAAEEESREANGESSTEPQLRDMPTQVEVAEEESRDANSQSSIEPQWFPLSPDFFPPNPPEQMVLQIMTATDIGVNSDQRSQAECQFLHQSINHETRDTQQNATMPLDNRDTTGEMQSQVQNRHGNSQHSRLQTSMDIDASIAPQHTSDSRIIEATIVDPQVPEAATYTTGPSSSQVNEKGFSNREHAERHCIFRVLEQERIPGNVIAALTSVSHPPNVEGAINLQFPQDMPPLTQSRELKEGMGQEMRAADIANPPFDGAANCYSAPPLPNLSFTDELLTSFIGSLDLETSNAQLNPDAQLSNVAATGTPQHSSQPLQSNSQCGHRTGLVPPIPSLPFYGPLIVESIPQIPDDPRTSEGESISCSTMASAEDVPYLLHSPYPEEMQMSDQQTTTGASSFQYDQLPAVGNSNCLQDCNQHSQLQTPTDINPSIPSQHTIDSQVIEAIMVDLQVPEAATNTIGPSSSQDMNRGSPIMDVGSIYANDEEIRNLKRKVEELDDKDAVIKEQMEIESAASSVRKKPRILVKRWLKETERAKNNFQIIGQANAETLPPKQQVETLTREVEELIGKTLPHPLLIVEREAKGVKFLERKLTGKAIRRNIELIWDHLTKNHGCKMGIYGMGGVGKTTIMMHIHNRLINDATFDRVVFITVSKDFSIYKLQSDIGKALKCDVMEDEDEKKRAAMLSEHLERKKNCVLILDDVWEHLDLEEVGIPIRAHGFKFVLTTRSFDVCRQMQCQEKIKIEPLSQEEAKSLFMEELGPETQLNLEIEAIMKSIVKECAGLPIGVIMMARSMREVTNVFQWRDSLTKLKESSMGQTDLEKKLLMNLKVSYDRLGNPNIQQCFLSCALYPEDKFIDEFELIEFFIDQGLIDRLPTRIEQYDRGLTILNQLANACLLEYDVGKVKMHDLLRDMALHIMGVTSMVKAGKGLKRIPPEEYWTDALEKVSLMESKISEIPLNMSPSCPNLSTLLLNGSLSENVVLPDSFFKQLCGLKVLNLSGCELTKLPNSFSDLVNLRVLLLRDCRKLRRIPYLGKLTSLRKLNVSGCSKLEEVPEGLEMLVNLTYLELRLSSIFEFREVVKLPERVLGGLQNLQHLEVDFLDGQDMTNLRALETLECSFEDANDFNKCVRVIEQSNPHCYYYLRMVHKDYCGSEEFDCFTLIENPKREVEILGWDHAIVSVGGECTGIFILIPQDVQIMKMNDCDGITNLSGMGPLEYLERLCIVEWENLRVLRGGHDEEAINIHDSPAPTLTTHLFPSLRFLEIWQCPKLKYLFGYGSKSNLPHLRGILIYGCEEMVGIIAAVTSPPPHSLPFFPSLKQISIEKCNKMKRVVESEWMPHFPTLRSIKVSYCEKMEEIIGGPPPYSPVEEISLQSLDVGSCNNMRKLLPHEWLLHLRNLQSIKVGGCKGMVELISGAGQGQEGSITTFVNNTPSSFQPSLISLPKLECLELHYLHQLKSIYEAPISCDSMKRLDVYGCPELKRIPLQLPLREIEELPYIWVEDEEKWKTLMWDHPDAQAILQPYLQKGKHAKGMPFCWEREYPPNAIELFAKGKGLLRLCS